MLRKWPLDETFPQQNRCAYIVVRTCRVIIVIFPSENDSIYHTPARIERVHYETTQFPLYMVRCAFPPAVTLLPYHVRIMYVISRHGVRLIIRSRDSLKHIDYGCEDSKEVGDLRGDIGAIELVLTPSFRKSR